jgi:hypothetical protein
MLYFVPSCSKVEDLCAVPLAHLVFNTFRVSSLVFYELQRQCLK